MNKTLLLVTLLLSFLATNAMARKPAVEPFAGVETESYNATSKGVEVNFNFGNHIYAYKKPTQLAQKPTSQLVASVTLVSFVLLPFLMWAGITSLMKKETTTAEAPAEVEQPEHKTYADTIDQENVASLSDHRKDKSTKDNNKKAA